MDFTVWLQAIDWEEVAKFIGLMIIIGGFWWTGESVNSDDRDPMSRAGADPEEFDFDLD